MVLPPRPSPCTPVLSGLFLLAVEDQNRKLPSLQRRNVQAMSLGVERHGLGTLRSRDTSQCGVTVSRVLLKNSDAAFAQRIEHQFRLRVERRWVDVISNRVAGNNPSGISVCDGHQMISAPDENPAIGCVKSHAGRRSAR